MRSRRTSSRGPGSTSSTTSRSSRAIHSWPFRTWCFRRTTPGRRPKSSATGCCGRSRTSRTISPGSRPTSWSPRSEHGAEAPDGGHVLMAVRSFEITRRSAVLDGRPFGATGAYEKIVGVLRFGIDPTHPANQAIADIGLAPRSAEGLVEAAADFYLLRPVDPARGKRRLLLDIPNRGRKVALGMFYELVYRAENPPLVGLGLLAVRDTAAWLRSGSAAAGNPCAGELDHAYVIGVSQTGRFLRHLLYLGLNEDEAAGKVFDGVIAHIAGARRGEFNQRFGQPSLNATSSVGSLFPFTDASAVDRVTGKRGAQLARLEARGTVPKIVAVNTSAEYWRGDAP